MIQRTVSEVIEAITYIEQLSTPNTKIQNLCKETASEGYNPYHR